MNILFLTNSYPDFESSYRGIFIKKMATLLKGEGYRISIVTPKIFKGSLYFEKQDGMNVYRFPFLAGNKLLIEYSKVPYLRMVLYFLTGFFLTAYAILKNKCNVIHVHWAIPPGLIGVWVGWILKKPVVVTIHGSDLRLALERSGFLRKIFVYVCHQATHLNCVSGLQKKEVEQLGVKSQKISVIPMGVDGAFLEIGKNRKTGLKKRSFTILSNRNLHPIYNVSLLIRAIPIVLKEEPDTKFLIAGEGPDKEDLEREVKKLTLNSSVQFLGRIPHREMPSLLAQSDIYVSTSIDDGASVSLLEAMGSGALPIVTDIPPNREWIVDGKNGFLVPINEAEILASKIIEIIRHRTYFGKIQSDNLQIVEREAFWPKNINKLEEIYSIL